VRRGLLVLILVAAGLAACGDRVGVGARGGNKQPTQWGVKIKLPPPE